MEKFQEIRDFELMTQSDFESIIKLDNNPDYTYVVVKDSADYSNDRDENKINRSYYFIIKNSKQGFMKSCLAFAVGKLLPSLTSYQAEAFTKEY